MAEEPLHLIVGLGNPGQEYAQTRHNAGFEVVKELLRRHSFGDKKASKLAHAYRGSVRGKQVLMIKPLTFMNLSGNAVQHFVSYFKVPLDHLLVVYDDFALPLGRLRMRANGSAGGQNGLKSIIACLGTEAIPRLRIGIGPVPDGWDPADFVLSRFRKDEEKLWNETLTRAADCVESWLERGVEDTASRFNVSTAAENSEPKGPTECHEVP